MRSTTVSRLVGAMVVSLLAGCSGTDAPPPEPSPTPSGQGNWVPLPPLLEARQELAVAELGGRIYAAGGFRGDGSSANTVEVFDPATVRWSFVAPMPRGVNHPMAAVHGGRLFVFGGDSGGALATTQEYDPATNTWGLRANMPTARAAGLAATIGDRIYVAGGSPAGRALEAYEPAADRWVALAPMPTARNHLAGGVIAGRFHVVGGRPPDTMSVHEVFDPATNSWTTASGLPTGRSGHAGAVVRGCLYVFGGEGNPAATNGVFNQNEVYDPRSNAWSSVAPMAVPRHGIGAAVIGTRIYVPGGATVQGFGTVATSDLFEVPSDRTCS
jgi:N-acetylneuraminic acid mutarotase